MTLALDLTSYSLGLAAASETNKPKNGGSRDPPFPSPQIRGRTGGLVTLLELESPRGSDEELFAESLFENWTKTQQRHREEALRPRKHPHETFKPESDAWTSGMTSSSRPGSSKGIKPECDVSLTTVAWNLRHTFGRSDETCYLNENLRLPCESHESNRCAPGIESHPSQDDTDTATRVSAATAHFTHNSRKPSNAFSPVIPHISNGNSRVSINSHSTTTTMAHPRDPNASPSASTDPWMKGSPSKRSRSRAIPIKPRRSSSSHHHCAFHENHPEESDASWSHDGDAEVERMYDWATWRLYHRIVEHREKYPLTASYFESTSTSPAPGGAEQDASRKGSHPSLRGVGGPSSRHASSVHFDRSPLEGEVFELDL